MVRIEKLQLTARPLALVALQHLSIKRAHSMWRRSVREHMVIQEARVGLLQLDSVQ